LTKIILMNEPIIDFRSDTVTKPSPEMLDFMFKAKVGDDVFNEDETTNELQSYAATLFGMEAALYCPSGTMTNEIAIKAHTQPGNEVICDKTSHIYNYEGGGVAFNSGCQIRPINGDRGRIEANQVKEQINPDDIHKAQTSLVSLENTSNRGGGSYYEFNDIIEISGVCKSAGLKLHLDGARLFNALTETGESPKDYGKVFDSISLCLSKGLGAPVGSLILGSEQFIKKCRRIRKVMGGGMRQTGYIAAAGLFALQHNIERLKEDHRHARDIATALKKKNFIGEMMPVDTNIIIFEVKESETSHSLTDKLAARGIKVIPISNREIRIVLHLDITEDMVARTINEIENL